ncbi:MAG: DUF4276 family protein [Calditrichaeota bacterium]|nr:DUF4276 family protein [Calditrichota bacterium]
MKAIIYIEGDKRLKSGFRMFFDKYFNKHFQCSSNKTVEKLVLTDSKPIKDFLLGIRNDRKQLRFHILLMDSDILKEGDPKKNVRNVNKDEWKKAKSVKINDDQLHFMVQNMEAWFMADTNALTGYYGSNLEVDKLPKHSIVEDIPAEDIEKKLKAVTRGLSNRKNYYDNKPKHGSEILSRLDPEKVIKAAPHCKALFNTLETVRKG